MLKQLNKSLKFGMILVISIVLTLGFSVSLQSLLAAWTAPTSNPPANNIGDFLIGGSLGVGTNVGINGKVGIGTAITSVARTIIKATSSEEGLRIISSDWSPLVIRDKTNTTDFFRVNENGNIGIGTTNPAAKLEVAGTFAITNTALNHSLSKITRKFGLVNFTQPVGDPIYISGQEWAPRYYHIRTPDINQSYEMYRYDLTGYSYGIARPISFTWVGYLYLTGIYNQSAIDNAQNNIPVNQYIGGDNHLYLKFGPIPQYYNSFVLDYQSGSINEVVIHEPSGYQVFLRSDSGNY